MNLEIVPAHSIPEDIPICKIPSPPPPMTSKIWPFFILPVHRKGHIRYEKNYPWKRVLIFKRLVLPDMLTCIYHVYSYFWLQHLNHLASASGNTDS